MYKRNVYL